VSAFDFDLDDDEPTGEQPRAARAPVGAVLIPLLALIIAIYLEIALAIDARLLGAVPNLVLIVVVAVALRYGALVGACAGFAAGLLIDIAVQGPFGASALVLTPLGWGAGVWAERRRRVSLGMALVVLLVATLLLLLGEALVATTIANQAVAWGTFPIRALAELAATLLVGILLLPLLRRVMGVPEQDPA
jgi:rod shape-determining protein MreD